MNQNKNTDVFIRAAIDLPEILWKLLEQWKCVLIFALIIMLLLLRFQYGRSVTAAQNAYENAKALQEVDDADILATLAPNEQGSVASVVSMERTISDVKDYINKSVLMQMDPYKVRELHVVWNVKAEEELCSALAQAYAIEMHGDKFCRAVQSGLKNVDDLGLIKELVIIESNASVNTALESGVIACDILLPDDADVDQIMKQVQAALSEIQNETTEKIGTHELEFLSSEDHITANLTVLQKQAYVYSSLYTFNQSVINMKSSFTPAQNAVYSRLVSQGETEEVQVPSAPEKPAFFQKKIAVIGFLAGVIVYVICYILYLIVARRIYAENVLESNSDFRMFGAWHGRQGGKVREILLCDPFISRLHNKSGRDKNVTLLQIVKSLVNTGTFRDISKFLIVSGRSLTKGEQEFLDSIKEKLADEGIGVSVISANRKENGMIQDEDVAKCDAAVLMVDGNRACVRDYDELILLCDYYNKPVLGSIYID